MNEQKSALISRNITVNHRRTSVRLEAQMWIALKDIATREKCTIHDICTVIAARKSSSITLTAAIRIFLMLYYKAAATEEGHRLAGHGGFKAMVARVSNHTTPSYQDDKVYFKTIKANA